MRSTTIRTEPLSLAVQQQIDACCDRFEQALQAGQSPSTSEYLAAIPPIGQAELLRELTAIESAYQRTQSQRESAGLHLRCPHCQNQVELLADARLEDITCSSCGDTFSLVDEHSDAGGLATLQRIAQFELIACLGTGGFGSVWKARDTELDRLVALKIPRKSQLTARETEQFFREARTAAQLKHPHIVPVHEVGKEGSVVFIVTDLIDGIPLSTSLQASVVSPQETARLCATLAEAVAYAHQQGVIHRDLKPSNVMLDRDSQPHIMDFGLAKREMGEITMTVDGTVLGTPAYMSPEQAMGKSQWIDRRTDIYSLGVMLFLMLTRELPYRGTVQQQIQQRVVDDAPDPRKLNVHIPADLATICLKCLERDPNRRFANARALAAELRRYLAGEPIESRPISNIHRVSRWAKRKPALAAAALLTCILAIGGPLAAVTIESQRQDLILQRDNKAILHNRKVQVEKAVRQRLKAENLVLQRFKELNPDRVELSDWREQLIADFIDRQQSSRASLLAAGERASEPETMVRLVRRHLGWVYLLRAHGMLIPAREHSEEANRLLAKLQRLRPQVARYQSYQANCLQELSELQSQTGQHQLALQSAAQALSLRTALAAEHPEQLAYQLDQFESQQWQLSQLGAGAPEAKFESLGRWRSLKNELQQKLANEHNDFYSLSCYLTLRQPWLQSEPMRGDQGGLADDLSPVAAGQVLEQDEIE